MDKPNYISIINSRYPEVTNEQVKEYLFTELKRQMDDDISSMFRKIPKHEADELISYLDGVSTSGKSTDFDSVILGSNPSTPTIDAVSSNSKTIDSYSINGGAEPSTATKKKKH